MLWTDAQFISAEDLTSLDNEVSAVATAEGITLDGTISRAVEEAGDALLKHMQEFGGAWLGDGGVTANHFAALMNTGLRQAVRARVLLNQVVVSGPVPNRWTPLKRWAVYWALMLFYRDAANRTQNDRYDDKAVRYRKDLHGQYWSAVRDTGLPIVRNPLPCPGALYEPDAGTWTQDAVTTVAGAGTVAGDYEVAVSWVESGRSNGESNPSARLTVSLAEGQVLRVNIGSLMPPTGAQPACTRAQAQVSYGRATHWKVYAGPAGGVLRLQAESLVTLPTYTFSGDPATDTAPIGTGQYPDTFMAFQQWNQRG